MQPITLSATRLKEIAALKLKKHRQKYDKFLAEGEKISLESIHTAPHLVQTLIATQSWWDIHYTNLKGRDMQTLIATEDQMKKLSSLANPPAVMLLMNPPPIPADLFTVGTRFILCDDIQDPGNLGTIVRIADWFGIDAVLCSIGCVDLYNSKSIQSTMGSFLRVPVLYDSIESFKSRLSSHFTFIAADMKGQDAITFDWPGKSVLVIGNEGHGLSKEAREFCSETVSILKAPGSSAESLNAAISTGILCALMSSGKNQGN
jgi:TrmH family RNA methyltransferase